MLIAHRARRVRSARVEKKAGGCCNRLIKTTDRLRTDRREAVFLFRDDPKRTFEQRPLKHREQSTPIQG